MSDLMTVMRLMNKMCAGIPFTEHDRETIARVVDSHPAMQAEKREKLGAIFKPQDGE